MELKMLNNLVRNKIFLLLWKSTDTQISLNSQRFLKKYILFSFEPTK